MVKMASFCQMLFKRPHFRLCSRNLCNNFGQETCIRLVNPLQRDRNSIVENLCKNLQENLPGKYPYLKLPNDLEAKISFHDEHNYEKIQELFESIQSNEKSHEENLELFESWLTSSKLKMAFYLIANKNKFFSEEFSFKVIQSLSNDLMNFTPEEFVAFWLYLYFSREKTWIKEELYEHLDFNVAQIKLARLLASNQLSIQERIEPSKVHT